MKNNSLCRSGVRVAISRAMALLGQGTLVCAVGLSIFACNSIQNEMPSKPKPNDTLPGDTLPGDSLPGDSVLTPVVPVIKFFGVVGGDTTISVGSRVVFAPVVEVIPAESARYKWVVNGDSLADTPTFEFSRSDVGSYDMEFFVSNSAGEASHSVTIHVKGFVGGFFIINEGWFGHDMGSVNYFNAQSLDLQTNIYGKANGALELGATTCYGAIWDDRIYLISKQGRRLVVCNAMTFEDLGSLGDLGAGDGRAFAGVSSSQGVVTTSEGAYVVNLSPLSLGAMLEGSDGAQCGGVYVTDQYIFVINESKGILIYDAKSFRPIKQYAKGEVGFARTLDGSLWAAHQDVLVRIDPVSLQISEVALPDGISIGNSWGSWNSGSLCGAAKENALYFTKSGAWGGSNQIYRYKVGDATSLSKAFATSTAQDDAFYGSGIGVDPISGDILATMVKDGWGDSYQDNRMVVFDGATGVEKNRKVFQGYWFPGMVVFNK